MENKVWIIEVGIVKTMTILEAMFDENYKYLEFVEAENFNKNVNVIYWKPLYPYFCKTREEARIIKRGLKVCDEYKDKKLRINKYVPED